MRKITIKIADRQEEYLKKCLETGIFGDTLEDVVERFISHGICDAIRGKLVDKLPLKAAKK